MTNSGTCPCCFRNHKILKSGGMVHHGYRRPGDGCINGDCFGVGYPRFEVSCGGTVAYRAHLTDIMTNRLYVLKNVQYGEVDSFYFSYQTFDLDDKGDAKRDAAGRRLRKFVAVEVKRGAEATTFFVPGAGHVSVPSYESLRAARQRELQSDIDSMSYNIKELTEAIDSWKRSA